MIEEKIYKLSHIGMALFFLYALFFQNFAGNWLLANGLIILVLEAYALMINDFVVKWYYENALEIKEKFSVIVMIVLFLLIASYFAYSTGIFVLAFFWVSFVINFYHIKSKIKLEQRQETINYNLLMLAFSLMLALIVFTAYSLVFEPSNLVKTISKHNPIEALRFPELIAPWGFLYFLFLAVNPMLTLRKTLKKKHQS
ncbi:MAG: hypothetical protein COT15_01245 [Candidatus Diapherotrites archaeon CG08_land_8_20_14_0_20_34_12]|nr:MAG: hypothetical protein COT15_01245 [Candidatus Diapherotrites archaeon CG08_land_8_20_14_0_20_34_12]